MMLREAFLFSALLLTVAKCDVFSDFAFLNNQDPYDWTQSGFHSRRFVGPEPSTPVGREREPLDPSYKDPAVASSDQKPVLNPKPKQPSSTTPRPNIVPGGIVDVDANGVAKFPFSSPFGPDFDFPGFGKPGSFGFGGIFGLGDRDQWWKGPNVCIEREESTDDEEEDEKATSGEAKKNETEIEETPNLFQTSIRLSNCFETPNKYECITKINNHGVVKTFTVRYKCCYGYKRTDAGCTEQVELKPLLDTLDDLKLEEFKMLIKNTGLDRVFTEGNYTLFAPNDDALNDYNEKMIELNKVDQLRRRRVDRNQLSTRDLVLSHAVKGFVDLNDLSNEQIIHSEDRNSTIRINIYPTHTYEKMLTANCARVKKGNILAKNGIVHITDRVVVPSTESIEQIIRSHPKLTSLRKALENTDIPKHLKPDGHYTIFAPTDEAFAKLNDIQRQKLLNGGGGCASNILKHHVTAHTVCSSAIIGNATTHNVEGAILNMERTLDDELIFENKAKIVEADIVATNGVIHLINEVVIPESGQYLENVLKSSNFTKFEELIEKADLTDEVNNLENATVFVPSNEAFEKPQVKKLLEEIGDNKEKLKELVRYHTVDGEMESYHMNNNLKLKTRDEGRELRINLYSTLPLFTNVVNRATVNCARLVGFDEKACGSVVHEVNSVLIPPPKTIYELLAEDPKYSTLTDLIKGTEVETILKESNRSITFLAPTDETFAALEEDDRKMLKENKEKAEAILKGHILEEILCCSGVGPHTWGFSSFVPTMGSSPVEVGRVGSQVRVNRAVVTSCDNLATNGVVHTINKVLAPRKRPVATIGGGLFYFDF